MAGFVIRMVVSFSLIAHVLLAILAGIRRRQASGVGTFFLWVAYQLADWATPFVLSSSSLEQHLVGFWLPFIVMHLGGPDNITAYSLEDNKLSLRLLVGAAGPMFTIGLLLYKQVQIFNSKGVLLGASLVMVVVAVCKYVEKVIATYWNADFANLLSSSSKKKQRTFRIQPCRSEEVLRNEKALLLAHELLDITKQAFADDYLGEGTEKRLREDPNLKVIFSVNQENTGWKNMCKVVEMELSLMYDILYTKATVVHTWYGYTIRIISPIITVTVVLLFWLYIKEGQRKADAIISYSLMAVTFLLDVRWLLRAAASTWTYAYFNSSPTRWLHHEVCCTRRWRRLRHFVVSLDPWQVPLLEHGGGYRRWSGTIGQYNLFHEVTHDTSSAWLASLRKKLSLEDAWMDYKYSNSKRHLNLNSTKNKIVKKLMFKQIQKEFNMEYIPPTAPPVPIVSVAPLPIGAAPGLSVQRRHREFDEDLKFLPEIQELILIWHVTTEVFLCGLARHSPEEREEVSSTKKEREEQVTSISALSNYMAFLAAVRSEMLPGLKLRSRHQAAREALEELWRTSENGRRSTCTSGSSKTGDEKKRLVEILKTRDSIDSFGIIVSDGIKFGNLLTQMLDTEHWEATLDKTLEVGTGSRRIFLYLIPDLGSRRPKEFGYFGMLEMLKLLLKSWVRMLIYISIRCSTDSHAKQLGRGCELTTVVWILSEHATIFRPPRDPDVKMDDNFDNGMQQMESHAMQSSPWPIL